MELLEYSLKSMKDCLKEYNLSLKNDSGCNELKLQLRYHMFSFTQLVYSLKERLRYDYKEKASDIHAFFEMEEKQRPRTAVGLVIKLANSWKHEESVDIRQNFSDFEETDKRKGSYGELFPKEVIEQISKIVGHSINSKTEMPILKATTVTQMLPQSSKFQDWTTLPLGRIFEDALTEVKGFLKYF
jgi:hypothetical protein